MKNSCSWLSEPENKRGTFARARAKFALKAASRIETRIGSQAVIVRRHRLYFALRWLARGHAEQRYVISVDQHGQVDSLAAEPIRW